MSNLESFFAAMLKGAASAAVVVLAATFGFSGNAAAQSTPQSTDPAAEVEGWIYLGRLDSAKKRWAPRSGAISGMQIPARGSNITIANDSVLVGDIEKNVSSPEVSQSRDPLALAPAGTKTKILSVRDFASIGKGAYRWAKVKVRPTYRTS